MEARGTKGGGRERRSENETVRYIGETQGETDTRDRQKGQIDEQREIHTQTHGQAGRQNRHEGAEGGYRDEEGSTEMI